MAPVVWFVPYRPLLLADPLHIMDRLTQKTRPWVLLPDISSRSSPRMIRTIPILITALALFVPSVLFPIYCQGDFPISQYSLPWRTRHRYCSPRRRRARSYPLAAKGQGRPLSLVSSNKSLTVDPAQHRSLDLAIGLHEGGSFSPSSHRSCCFESSSLASRK